MSDEPTFRCGWRYQRPPRNDMYPFSFSPVIIRRGEWRMTLDAPVFDAMPDESFVDYVTRCYRDSAFEQLQQDLNALARQVVGELETTKALVMTDVPFSEVKAVLYRWQKAKQDTQEPT